MSLTLIALLGIMLLFLLILVQVPISFSMLIVGFVGIFYLSSFQSAVNMLTADLWNQLAGYTLSVILLFILMGELIYRSGMAQGMFNTAHNWVGHFKGGLALTTILASAGFSTISGSNSATAATMGTIALPELKRYGYDDKLSTGTVASGGTLGIIIPPSTVLIIFAIQTNQSIKQLFMASVIPSIILVALFLLLVVVITRWNPSLGPAVDKKPMKTRIQSLKDVLPIILLFLFVIGGLFIGWFTPTESAAFGSLGAFIITARRLNKEKILLAIASTLKTSSMVLFLIVGAVIFGRFLALTRLPFEASAWVESLAVPNLVILLAIILIFMIGGSLMDAMGFLIISIPIFFPIAMAIGYDPVWFAVLICIITSMGAITPPVGVNVFIVSGLRKDMSIVDIFKGTMYFLIPYAILISLLIMYPNIVKIFL